MLDILLQYILFLAEVATIALAVLIVVIGILAFKHKQQNVLKSGKLVIENLSDKIKEQLNTIRSEVFSKKDYKTYIKSETKTSKLQKNKKTGDDTKAKLFVIDFAGDIKAGAVVTLQHALNALLPIIDPKKDEILVKLESGGGMVHAYGLAASQLDRIRKKNIKLTIAVDKIAASGGYMMACVADEIVAAPFAIIGSIGVIGQVPNFNKLLEKHHIDFEQHTAGEFKRTLTVFGKNDNKSRDKFKEELEITHDLFKNYIKHRRPTLDLEQVATGEHWYGQIALDKKLIDRIATSDDLILEYFKTHDLFEIKYEHKKSLSEKLSNAAQASVNSFISAFKNSNNIENY